MSENKPQVGTGVAIFNEKGQVLFGYRPHFPAGYSMPGGKVEFLETVEDCCVREALEETGLHINKLEIVAFGNDIKPDDNFHFVTLFACCQCQLGEVPQNTEPDKCNGWNWYHIDDIPTEDVAFNYMPVFKDDKRLLRQYALKHHLITERE